MATREDKLAAARKKLRAFLGKNETDGSRVVESSNASSPSPSITSSDRHRSESPTDHARTAYERRETLQIIDAQMPEQAPELYDPFDEPLSPFESETGVDEAPTPPATEYQQHQAYQNAFQPSQQAPIPPTNEYQQHQVYQNAYHQPSQQVVHNNVPSESHLTEQLRRQGMAINVLVAERNGAQAALSRVQAQLHEKSDSLEDLKLKYKDAIQRVRQLEESQYHNINPPLPGDENRMAHELFAANQKISVLEEQLSEVRQRLESKKVECESLGTDVKQLRNDLSVASVQIQQLSISETSVSNIRLEELETQKKELEGKVGLLERRLQAVALEGEQAGHKFQMYADQCTTQITTLRNQVRELTEENIALKSENEGLKVSNQIAGQVASLEEAIAAAGKDAKPLKEKIVALTEKNSKLCEALNEKESELLVLKSAWLESGERLTELENELHGVKEEKRRIEAKVIAGRPDPGLLAAMESDKVAASRAVAQNQRLKETLADLEAAYVRVSNERSVLVDKLISQEHLNKELQKQVDAHAQRKHSHCDDHHDHSHNDEDAVEEQDVDSLRHLVKLLRKDKTELMLRLQAQSAGNQQNGVHEHKHEHSEHEHIHENDHAHHKHEHSDSEECSHEHDEKPKVTAADVEKLQKAIDQLQEDKAELTRRLGALSGDPKIAGLLEEKLRKTMEEIAKLDEEKQRLEHLVLQLQEETETIGEYISLYQKQRQLLRKRSIEKDEQLVQLTRDREDLKEKLSSLNDLVQKLIGGSQTKGLPTENAEEATAERIREIITEIENNNVVTAHNHGVEHCFCCSGQLQTV